MNQHVQGLISNIVYVLISEGAQKVFKVGGCVRDSLLGIEPKDIDLEVYGLTLGKIEEVLASRYTVDTVGKSFGVLKIANMIDISIPHRENRLGADHKDFLIQFDPNLSVEEALKRRDFTINSMAIDCLSGQLIDPFNGVKDLNNRILRMTSADTFGEDSLRVLRGMQFASRFNLNIEFCTALMCHKMLPNADTISKDRMWQEWLKWSKGKFPGKGLRVLQKTKWIELYPELHLLIDCPQALNYYPEGCAFFHSVHVCDAMSEILQRNSFTEEESIILMLSALLHDIGKPQTTRVHEDGKITSYGHDKKGALLVPAFLERINAPNKYYQPITVLVKEHMAHIARKTPSTKAVKRLSNRLKPLNFQMWSAVVEADCNGRPPLEKSNAALPWVEKAKELNVDKAPPQPIITGKWLLNHKIDMLSQGPLMGLLINEAYKSQLNGRINDEKSAIQWIRSIIGSYNQVLNKVNEQVNYASVSKHNLDDDSNWDSRLHRSSLDGGDNC